MSITSQQAAALRAYEYGEKLFGRDWECRQLRALMVAERLVLLYAPSGAGKTSLVQAGLIPQLHGLGLACDKRPIQVSSVIDPARFGGSWNRYLLSALITLDENRPREERLADADLAAMSLANYLAQRYGEDERQVVLIFDQFEEVLTVDPENVTARRDFFLRVGELLRNPRYLALFVIREDFLAGLSPYLELIPNRLSARFHLDMLDLPSAHAALIGMAREDGITFLPSAASILIRRLSAVQVRGPDGAPEPREGSSVEPVYLRVVYMRLLNSGAQARGVINDNDIEDYGDVDKALVEYYNLRVSETAVVTGFPERHIRAWVEQHLITSDGRRGQVPYIEQAPAKATAASIDNEVEGLDVTVIKQLIRVYLVRREDRRGMIWLELAHDRLILPIQQSNKTWAKHNTRPFHRQFEAWRKGDKAESLLLTDRTELRRARKTRPKLSSEEEEFLDKSLALWSRRQARVRRTNLADIGWAIVLPKPLKGVDQLELEAEREERLRQEKARIEAVFKALTPLRVLRRRAFGRQSLRYRECVGEIGYQPGDTAAKFLDRLGSDFRSEEPGARPYLLLVGGPEDIPFEFQYELAAMRYPVGRIAFDTPGEYKAYARAIVAAETQRKPQARHAVVLAPRFPLSGPTMLMQEHLIAPLQQDLAKPTLALKTQFYLGEEATKTILKQQLAATEHPAVLFIATYGAPPGNPEIDVGALVAAEWNGFTRVRREHCITADDLDSEVHLGGMIAFLFSAHSAGTMRYEDTLNPELPFKYVTERDLIARLPRAMLAAGALAVVGHVNTNWTYSFSDESLPDKNLPDGKKRYEHSIFRQFMLRLYEGHTIGSAMEGFSERSIAFSGRFIEEYTTNRRNMILGQIADDDKEKVSKKLQELVTARNDIRNFIILGDPAAHLNLDE